MKTSHTLELSSYGNSKIIITAQTLKDSFSIEVEIPVDTAQRLVKISLSRDEVKQLLHLIKAAIEDED